MFVVSCYSEINREICVSKKTKPCEHLKNSTACVYIVLRKVNVKLPAMNELTPWRTVLPEKLTGPQLVKKFPAFYGTRKFITVFTKARHCPYTEPD
jgi:hypothetical protein